MIRGHLAEERDMMSNSATIEQLRVGECKAFDTARSHISAAKILYREEYLAQACFLAIAAIEEVGRGLCFQHISTGGDPKLLESIQKDHQSKAVRGAVLPLILNDGAKERHGKNPRTGLCRIQAVSLLAEARGEWVSMRSRCLFVELDARSGDLRSPGSQITREHAYLMIMAALEAYAQVQGREFSYRDLSLDEIGDDSRQAPIIEEINEFQQQERSRVDLDRLDIVSNTATVEALKKAADSSGNWP
jgi:AbiV family abortive infection protein